ncbi:Gryzun, putative trafficking through golgi-domain-containing protein [Multifurca ochricompacta]|uniref:Gryzun, putative trafficking through golgi-domain-containing protein n=1 Tax=Multifurca ochricompacta TaxID=376703 RepID=A0AAD4M3W7_9AGAM|nr:Gryzun, putative trafficking through golgi-domain-containing protein [Multifurca ochricompacta]
MNSYPPELLVQLAPVMFVAGLDVPPPPESTPSAAPGEPPSTRPLQDPFTLLTIRLRDALLSQRTAAIWQPDKSKTFQTVLVDKDVRFPPRKIPLSTDPHSLVHSPLSPLTPTSPLHPDGLIAPIWVRKHTTLVPSVFVVFIRLYESPPHHMPRSPLDQPHPDREAEERRRDAEMSAEIALRKKSTSERGIKLTVVLIASRKMLDDPALDTRLTFIRRQSGLDYRAALFVLSPVSPGELNEFIKSLQQALYEPAVDYYTSHSKRVRRKRNRHAQAASAYVLPVSPLGVASPTRPLRPEGWTVRYEYKMACFAEFRGEFEVALKHYQDAYSSLLMMFGSTAILPPRTKRWAEAKVLADCINLKICKLYLYNNEHALALSQHTIHSRRFSDFSRGWGIGDETFEFWSWIARQHRVFAELLEHGTSSTLILPAHKAAIPVPAAAPSGLAELDALRVLGLNPANALQHPGFYYYMAAQATERRRAQFFAMLESVEANGANLPGFANEKKVDHSGIALELYTKAYELFKKHSPLSNGNGQGRLTLRIAGRIAGTYYAAGKFDMAVRFFERIAKTYRRERWGTMLRPLLATCVTILVEMLAHGIDEDEDDDGILQEDLLAVLKSTVPSSHEEPLIVDLSDSEPIFATSIIFWTSTAFVGDRVAFQLSLTAPHDVAISALPFASLAIYFSHKEEPVVVHHDADAVVSGKVQRVDFGDLNPGIGAQAKGCLRWGKGGTIVFVGTVSSDVPMTLAIKRAVLALREGNWTVEIPIDPAAVRDGPVSNPKWLFNVDPIKFAPLRDGSNDHVTVHYRPHRLRVSMTHQSPAYLDEEYPIIISITNEDDRPLDVVLDVLLQPAEIDETVNDIRIDDEHSQSLIKGVAIGVIVPGTTALKSLYLTNTGGDGDRVLDISIQSRSPIVQDTSEVLLTLSVPTVAPMKVDYDVKYLHTRGPLPGLTDLHTYDRDYWDDREGGEAIIRAQMECVGPWGLSVETVRLVRKNGPHARVLECSLDEDEDDVTSDWLPGDEFAAICRISLSLEDETSEDDVFSGPGEFELSWRRILPNGDHGPLCTSRFPLPTLQPPRQSVIALLELPSSAKLHISISAHLTIRNHHPSRTASLSVQLEPDAADSFLIAGQRSARVPALLPGSEVRLAWSLIPIECGFVRVPRFRVLDKRNAGTVSPTQQPPGIEEEGIPVRVVDMRREERAKMVDEALALALEDAPSGGGGGVDDAGSIGPVLVLPSFNDNMSTI